MKSTVSMAHLAPRGMIACMIRALLAMALFPVLLVAADSAPRVAPNGAVTLVRVPNGGLQPEVAVDRAGVVHMVYLAGLPAAANVFYVRSSDGGQTFSTAVRVNSQEGSAIATGTIRGAQITIGRSGIVHVAWNGSDKALPRGPVNPTTKRASSPMLYTRASSKGTTFEPQRNLMFRTTDLDGGGSLATDGRGNVFVAWHGQDETGSGGEEARRVWIARSADDGVTFGREAAVSDPATGVCGCCALRLVAEPAGELQLLYRAATNRMNRDIYSLVSRDMGRTFTGTRTHGWEINACPMTSMSIAAGPSLLRAWETDGQVYYSAGTRAAATFPPLVPGNERPRRKHPRLAANPDGRVLLVWTDGTAWGRGGSVAWQEFDAEGRPTTIKGTVAGLLAWSFASTIVRPDGSYRIFY